MAQKITVRIVDRQYSLTATSPEQEELIRKAADDLNRRVRTYQDKLPGKRIEELLSFAALNVCMSNIKLQQQIRSLAEEEVALVKELESYLDTIDKK